MIEQVFNLIANSKEFAYDVETGGNNPLDWKNGYVCGYSFSDGKEAYYIPVRHQGGGNILYVENFESNLATAINKSPATIIGHAIKFDIHFSANHGIRLFNPIKDTMTREALINENKPSYSLGNTARDYNVTPKVEQKLYDHLARNFGVNPTRKSMGSFYRLAGNDPYAIEYGAGDTLTTMQLCQEQEKKLSEQELTRVADLESRLCKVLFKMERKGIRINESECKKVQKEIDDKLISTYEELPLGINVRSAVDLREYFEYCNVTDWPLTEKGNPSFNQFYLATKPEGEFILTARKLENLQSKFLNSVERFISNGRIHTNFNQIKGDEYGTVSGRLSSDNPNMQQIPKRDKYIGKIYRRMFIPDDDFIFIEFDYSQCEPRLYAAYSGEPVLVRGYSSTPYIDMHDVCAQLLGIHRDVAKNINLGILYYMGVIKLANMLGCTIQEAEYYLRQWYNKFRKVKEFRDSAQRRAEYRGFVSTILGRRRRLDYRWSYKAANSIIQGGAADILKYKMIQIDDWIESEGLADKVHSLLSIHDALLFQIHKSVFHYAVRNIRRIFEDVASEPFKLKIPFKVDFKMGYTWAEASYGR